MSSTTTSTTTTTTTPTTTTSFTSPSPSLRCLRRRRLAASVSHFAVALTHHPPVIRRQGVHGGPRGSTGVHGGPRGSREGGSTRAERQTASDGAARTATGDVGRRDVGLVSGEKQRRRRRRRRRRRGRRRKRDAGAHIDTASRRPTPPPPPPSHARLVPRSEPPAHREKLGKTR